MRTFVKAGVSRARAGARLAPDFERRLRASLPFARDVLFIAGILAYVIGFAYQTAQLRKSPGSGAASDPHVSSVLGCAAVALAHGAPEYACIGAGALSLAGLAAFAGARVKRAYCRPLVYALLAAGVALLVLGSAWFAWQEGSSGA